MLEASIERWVCQQVLWRFGVPNLKLNLRGNAGWPDRVFWVPGGRPLLVEFKRPGEEPRARQQLVHMMLRDLGYEVQVHDDKRVALEAVRVAAGGRL